MLSYYINLLDKKNGGWVEENEGYSKVESSPTHNYYFTVTKVRNYNM